MAHVCPSSALGLDDETMSMLDMCSTNELQDLNVNVSSLHSSQLESQNKTKAHAVYLLKRLVAFVLAGYCFLPRLETY